MQHYQHVTDASDKLGEQNGSLVEVKDLVVQFYLDDVGTVRAVDGVSFQIPAGKTLGVVGESGCGKSVTARSLLRLVRPPGRIVSGEILYKKPFDTTGHSDDGRISDGSRHTGVTHEVIDIASLDADGSRMRSIRGNEIAMVFQEPMTSLSPVHTIGFQLTEGILLHRNVDYKEAREHAIAMLGRVGVPNPQQRVDDYPHQFSGGMRQRAMIAMALACQPNLLIADEPTTALDVTTEAQIISLIKEIQESLGMAMMLITHNLGVVAEAADEVVVMYLGKVVEQTDVDTLFYSPQHPYTQALLNSMPRFGRTIKEMNVIPGSVPDPMNIPHGCPFHTRCSEYEPGLCDVEVPELRQVAPGQKVRCVKR